MALQHRPAEDAPMLALVLGGGNALGAYDAGACEALCAAGQHPGWVAGASMGAITAAILAGNPPERRAAALREFWAHAASPDAGAGWAPVPLRRPLHVAAAMEARLFGRPSVYRPRLALAGGPGLYDAAPLRRTLERLLDFGRLNGGETRVSVLALDLETGEEVVFDTARDRIGPDHLLASAALIPDFPPVRIDGRLLVDGGLAANVPLDMVLDDPPAKAVACFAVDPFPRAAAAPRDLLDAAERQSDLVYASQTARSLRAHARLWEARARLGDPRTAAVFRLEYRADGSETAMKGFDFSASALRRRREAGRRDMQAALALWRDAPSAVPGLTVHPSVQGGVHAEGAAA